MDDEAWLPAQHFQNNRVPRDRACFTCHTDYTLFGDAKAKLRGLRHVYVYCVGDPLVLQVLETDIEQGDYQANIFGLELKLASDGDISRLVEGKNDANVLQSPWRIRGIRLASLQPVPSARPDSAAVGCGAAIFGLGQLGGDWLHRRRYRGQWRRRFFSNCLDYELSTFERDSSVYPAPHE